VKQHLMCLVATIGLAVLAPGCASSNSDKDRNRANIPQPLSANSFARAWANNLTLDRGDAVRQLHVREDTLFLYTNKHLVYAIGRSGGDLKYSVQPPVSGGVLRPPCVLGQTVIYPTGSTLEVYNHVGRPLRTIELDKPIRSGAVGTGNTVYIGLDHTGGTGVVASVDITKAYRVINWELMTFGAVTPTPAYYERTIYAGSEDGRIYAVTEERGAAWSLPNGSNTFDTQGRFVSDVKVDDFGVYASNTDSKLYCLDRQTGRVKWIYYGGGTALKTAPVNGPTLVYQFVPGTGVVAIDKQQGQYNRAAKWIIKDAIDFLSEDEGHAYLRRKDNRIQAIDKQTGRLVFLSGRHPLTIFGQNQKDSTIYGTSKDGKVWAVRPVLREGEVGNVVVDLRFEPIASAR
jgi:outer membrane protein assembly factor BamB